MDLACTTCGEPWDLDELHYVDGMSFSEARDDFMRNGCKTFGSSHGDMGEYGKNRAAAASALYDLMGDDIDGIASGLEDFDGMF